MIIDGRTSPEGVVVEVDVCVIGAVPAGLTIAGKLIGSDLRVCVLESGDLHRSDEDRDLAAGVVAGYPYYELASVAPRVFGGASYVWDEWTRARPLDPIDFEKRDGVPYSGWPFGFEELAPFYDRAQRQMGLGSADYAPEHWGVPPLDTEGSGDLVSIVFQYTDRGDFARRHNEFDAASNVIVMLHSTAIEFLIRDSAVDVVSVACINGPRFSVRARLYVLATGGIENARLLLASRNHFPSGVGNQNDLVGRFFMEHPRAIAGYVNPLTMDSAGLHTYLRRIAVSDYSARGALTLSDEVVTREGLLNTVFLLRPSNRVEATEAFRSLGILRRTLRHGKRPNEAVSSHLFGLISSPVETGRVVAGVVRRSKAPSALTISATAEQAPNPSSRVVLDSSRDILGQPCARLEWRLGEQDLSSWKRSQEILAASLERVRVGRVVLKRPDRPPRRVFVGEKHHMGTTRMDDDPRRGVVDRNGKIHGVTNMFVAGSSVFPTVGYANPTLTIIALALRMVTRIERELSGAVGMGPFF